MPIESNGPSNKARKCGAWYSPTDYQNRIHSRLLGIYSRLLGIHSRLLGIHSRLLTLLLANQLGVAYLDMSLTN